MTRPLRVKFLSKTEASNIAPLWSPLIPQNGFDGIKFTFDPNDLNYDFLAVYEGLPKWHDRGVAKRFEALSCSRENTLLITTEPASIRIDGPNFMRQFGHVLTSKSPNLTQHPNHIPETPPLRWFYGRAMDDAATHATIEELRVKLPVKTKTLSTVCSTKRMSHTVHAARLDFVMKLRDRLPVLDVYGRGIRPVSDKAEAMQDYRYHIAIENHIQPGHWTEKLADCFLAGCLPFYYGDPHYATVFPKKSLIPIDIFDPDAAVEIIRSAMAEDAFTLRRSAVLEARNRVLNTHNTLGWVARFVSQNFSESPFSKNARIYSRHAFRRHHPIKALSDLAFRTKMQGDFTANPLQGRANTPH